mmetsp:Transcript_12482/g.21317  ORF Transcript_12482/g.21317 Transcript_12482/m.21317 type:complete len:113 (-) Transcript_12482:237-575(-)|eukprot:CAMPEP_0184692904 /NCGR_PEP_ID=MMETSP0313-20130426/1225_1 /TAXON_ID=2792 /ORGANISM="Porphyridium aerugineum, Strain SAG 1380-2" /LENGTH=112 /DNA_ID=CAMNT_0027150807 /DNA_START=80 /DNA_END=418 /DNA_ORIENTATION=-
MKYVAAYLLLVLGGSAHPKPDEISKLLKSVGIEPDATELDQVVKHLDGKKLEDLISKGSDMFASVPSGGVGGGAAPAAGGAAPAAAAGGKKEEAKKEEPKEEEEEASFDLFD